MCVYVNVGVWKEGFSMYFTVKAADSSSKGCWFKSSLEQDFFLSLSLFGNSHSLFVI